MCATEVFTGVFDSAAVENLRKEIKYCEDHIILPDIPKEQVKQKAIEIIIAHGITKESIKGVSKENIDQPMGLEDTIEKELVHWIADQIDKENDELIKHHNIYGGYRITRDDLRWKYSFMVDISFDFVCFINENL